ncbi:MAG: hypothetical protein KJ915_08265 [Candidatus Omnitrophica bacterium]|nr:hypothetical protein [Candidatus Omnitrophota bacterium]
MADCALAGQGTFLLNEQQGVPAMLSPQVQIQLNAFQTIYKQSILYPAFKERLRKSKSTEIYSIGGNSLLRGEDVKGLMPWKKDDWQKISDIQKDRIKETLRHILPELKKGGIITHGNGPEAGAVLDRWLGRFLDGNKDQEFINQKLAQGVKETQEWIGADIKEALMSLGISENQIEVVMTDVRVDAADEGFTNPKKPIGLARFKTVNGKEEPIPRVLVASPKPKSIVQIDKIEKAIRAKKIVICVGGGGIAVDMNNQARSLPAVIDKDLATACLAESLFKSRYSAEQKPLSRVIISTDVKRVYLDYGRSTQRPISNITADRLQQYIDSGEFAGTEGSMLPKLQAAISIIKSGAAKEVIITNPENLAKIDKGGLHTRIERSPKNSFDDIAIQGLDEKKTPRQNIALSQVPISAYPQQAGGLEFQLIIAQAI